MVYFFFILHYALLLLFGIALTFSFTGVRLAQRANRLRVYLLFFLCSVLQILVLVRSGYQAVWEVYPLIAHLPILLMLTLHYKKSLRSSIVALCTAYLCCNPANWIGTLVETYTNNILLADIAQILVLLIMGVLGLVVISPYVWRLFSQNMRSIWVFGSIPTIYYLYDYITGVYTDLWLTSEVIVEFLPFLLCVFFLLFCVFYYREYEQKRVAELREQIIRISDQQQAKQLEAIKRSEQEIRLLRHDLRLFLSTLGVCIESGDLNQAKEMLQTYDTHVGNTTVSRFCENDTLNYILSDFSDRCAAADVDFQWDVALAQFPFEDIAFISILSNALDNAFNAQLQLPEQQRNVRLMLKNQNQKLLLSVKNPTAHIPVFADGLPVSDKPGHGYGTQSIRSMTERLGGNCQFSVQDGQFIVRVVLNLPSEP